MARQLLQGVAEFGVATVPQELGDLLVGTLGVIADGPLETSPLRSQPHDARPPIAGVRLAGDVARALEMTEQVVDGLLRDLQLVGELARTLTLQARMPEHADVGRRDVVVSCGKDAGHDLLPHPLPAVPHQRAEKRLPRIGGFA